MGTNSPFIDRVSLSDGYVSFFERLLILIGGKVDVRPTLYGWYHLLCFAIVVALCALVFFKARNLSDKQMDRILGITTAILVVFEVYKQLLYTYNPGNDSWVYEWYAFPFQFCSTPMYVMLAAVLIKNEKVRTALYAYLATYGLFAGAVVMIYPGDVFSTYFGINAQTMIHHGAMVVIGVLMYVSGRAKLSHKTILKALPVFGIAVAIALGLNVLYHFFGDPNQTFNMFFISPYYPCTLAVLNLFYGKVPYVVFLMIYVLGFTAAGYIMSLIATGSKKLYDIVREKCSSQKQNDQPKEGVI